MSTMEHTLQHFLNGNSFDTHGRYIEEVINWVPSQLEHVHDYIQWVFPLFEPSRFNPDAPVLDATSHYRILHDDTAMENMESMLDTMENFYNLFLFRSSLWWVSPYNHNFLRLTRILKCLKLFKFNARADDLFHELEYYHNKFPDIISETTFNFWKDAAAGE